MIEVSVVIPTFNRRELLPRTIPALLAQDLGDTTYEVLFMDDGSTDDSREIIEEAAANSPDVLRYVPLPHTGSPAHARNCGVREAAGRVILLLDDDVIPDRDLIRRHAEFHREFPASEEAALGELYLPADVERDPMSLFHAFPYHEVRDREQLGFLFFWTCNVSLKRDFMLRHGMFDEDAVLHPVEDMECGYRLVQGGLRLRFLPEARGQHVHKMSPDGVARKGHRAGFAQYALTRKVPDIAVQERFGILTRDLRFPLLVWRTLRRAAFRTVDNPLTSVVLRALGARGPVRSWVTDSYYYLIFRRNMVAGHRDARRQFSHQGSASPSTVSRSRVPKARST